MGRAVEQVRRMRGGAQAHLMRCADQNHYVEEFTQPGDPLRLDYGYRNGAPGYVQALALGRDPSQAKVLAYTAERIRARIPDCEFIAITESEPARDNPRHQFIARLFGVQRIAIVPLYRIEGFAEKLRACSRFAGVR